MSAASLMMLALHGAAARAQAVIMPSFHPPAASPLEFIPASSAEFDAAVNRDFPGLATNAHLETIRGLVAYVRNNGPHSVLAYGVTFTVTPPHGPAETMYVAFMHPPQALGQVRGELPVLSRHEARVLSPWFNWGEDSYQTRLASQDYATFGRFQFVKASTTAKSVEIALDAVIGEDGVVWGDDAHQLQRHFEALRKGERSEGIDILDALHHAVPAEEVAQRLKADVEAARACAGQEDMGCLEKSARGIKAGELLYVLKARGVGGLTIAARNLAETRLAELHKASRPTL